jgi:hypothetical protein
VDDDTDLRESLSYLLELNGYLHAFRKMYLPPCNNAADAFCADKKHGEIPANLKQRTRPHMNVAVPLCMAAVLPSISLASGVRPRRSGRHRATSTPALKGWV